MPFENALAASSPSWQTGDTGWPSSQSFVGALGTTIVAADETRRLYVGAIGELVGLKTLVFPTLGPFYIRPVWANWFGTVCLQTNGGANPSGFYFGEDFVWLGPQLAAGLTVKVPERWRACIRELYVSWTVAAPVFDGEDKPILFLPTDGSTTSTSVVAEAGAQYGIRGAGAGALEFFSTIGGVLQEAVPLVWPEADFRNWVRVTGEHIAATPTAAAKFNLLLNGNVVISRDWEAGTTLPAFTDAVAGVGAMGRAMFLQGPNVNDMNVTMIRCRQGQFDFAGTEL